MIQGAAPGWFLAITTLTALAALLFAGAIRSGRWGVWLAGYLAALLALAAVLLATPTPVAGPPAHAEQPVARGWGPP